MGGAVMRRALFGILLTGLFVLLLSALVVAPQSAPPASSPPPLPRDFHAVLMPAALPAAQADLTVPEAAEDLQLQALQPQQTAADGTHRPAYADSNGRILRALRYENSFYQLFRPEVAGG